MARPVSFLAPTRKGFLKSSPDFLRLVSSLSYVRLPSLAPRLPPSTPDDAARSDNLTRLYPGGRLCCGRTFTVRLAPAEAEPQHRASAPTRLDQTTAT